jgi:hypothetical protein
MLQRKARRQDDASDKPVAVFRLRHQDRDRPLRDRGGVFGHENILPARLIKSRLQMSTIW